MREIEKKSKINSLLLVVLLGLPNFVNILVYYFKIDVIVLTLSLLIMLFGTSLLNNDFKINFKVLLTYIFLMLFLYISIFFNQKFQMVGIVEASKLLIYGGITLYISTQVLDLSYFRWVWYRMAILFLLFFPLLIPAISNRTFSYMNAGFILTFCLIGFIFKTFDREKIVDWVPITLIFILTLLFAHRGGILVNMGLILYTLFETKIIKVKYLIIFSPVIIFIFYRIFSGELTNDFVNLLNYFGDLFNSRSLKLIAVDLKKGTTDLTGRDIFYEAGMSLIEKNKVLPAGIGSFQYYTGRVFPHNILIDMYLIFGIFSLFIWIFNILSLAKVIFTGKRDFKRIYVILILMVYLELIINKTFITDFAFWTIIGFNLSNNYNETKSLISGVK